MSPAAAITRYPQGALWNSDSKPGTPGTGSNLGRGADEAVDGVDRRFGRTEVRTNAQGRVEQNERRIGHLAGNVFADAHRSDRILGALKYQHRHVHAGEVEQAVVGGERDLHELASDPWVGCTEARSQLLAKCRPIEVAHDHRGHGTRPAEVVRLKVCEQLVDVLAIEPADVPVVVDV